MSEPTAIFEFDDRSSPRSPSVGQPAMKKVTVITGGAGGMGLASAKLLGKDHHILIGDVNQQRLDAAIVELQALGISCEATVCDITDPDSVAALVNLATAAGTVTSVVHTAGLSPQMADPDVILKVNALGTIHITEAFLKIATDGFTLVNIASMSAHMLPNWIIPARAFQYALSDPQTLLKKLNFRCKLLPNSFARRGMAYAFSKAFVVWYSKRSAALFGQKNARVVSISPGTIDTQMGRLEEKSGSMKMLEKAALKRLGKPEDIAQLVAFCVSEQAAYITGIDILCDGGVVAAQTH